MIFKTLDASVNAKQKHVHFYSWDSAKDESC